MCIRDSNYTALKPSVDDPCGTNFFAAWESKLYVIVCGGIDHATTIKTVDAITLTLTLTLTLTPSLTLTLTLTLTRSTPSPSALASRSPSMSSSMPSTWCATSPPYVLCYGYTCYP